ncbi:MAG: T9SS type A sorting domain-containing protein [Cytophagaceae bacterium]|jgi:alpha-tubulin suppressor-like RCC1 family protein|nr:T9SS type A sorting domain-containing protein [Cytophagaceae bacterium]
MLKRILLLFSLIVLARYAGAQNFQISGGNSFSAAVCDNQTVYTWGSNVDNDGTTLLYTFGVNSSGVAITTPRRTTGVAITHGNINNTAGGTTVGPLPAIRQIDAGSGSHLLGLSCANQVWGWGNNRSGQLGRNSTSASGEPMPQRVLRGAQAAAVSVNDPNGIFLNNITYVSGGNNSSFAIEAGTGRLLAWGENGDGQLGDGTTTDRTTPVYVTRSAAEGGGQLTNIVQVEAGDQCTYALDANGFVWSWGNNTGNKLGRPGASPQTGAGRVVRSNPLCNGYGCPGDGLLRNITQISGGDTHCLALDATGNVWSFGGDWGEGQLGRGGGSVYQDYASRVVRPGLTSYGTVAADFLGSSTDGRAIYVSAGQASSAVVMANGKVVTFGGRGLFNLGPTNTNSGTITCPGPDGDMIASGTLGDNNTTGCNSTSCSNKATQWSRTPVYVQTGGVDLTGISAVSDGDGWYFAISTTGSAFAWGWNRRGELGVGDYSDRCQAVPFTLPTGCGTFTDPCPKQPRLGADFTSCPVFSTSLNSQVAQEYSSWRFTWEYRPVGSTGAWTTLAGPAANIPTQTANTLGQYRISMSDNRTYVSAFCGPCPVLRDTIVITEVANPYTVSACSDNPASLAQFNVTNPPASQIKWYTNATGGTALNPANTNPTITTAFSNTNTTIPGCTRALFAEDVSSVVGALFPGTTQAQAQTATSCATFTNEWITGPVSRSLMMFQVTRTLTINQASIIAGGNGGGVNATVTIYNNNPTGGPYCGGCTPAANTNGPNTSSIVGTGTLTGLTVTDGQVLQVPMSVILTPGIYWIGGTLTGVQTKYYNCTRPVTNGTKSLWTTQTNDNSGQTILIAQYGLYDNNPGSVGDVFNISFSAGTGYTCGRILVCVSSACTLPVTYVNFSASNNGNYNTVNWVTSSEKNAAYFVIERSSDGLNYAAVGKVNAVGNSSSIQSYEYKDLNPLFGATYYRLLQIDTDGSGVYSEPVYLNNSGKSYLSIAPNPSNGKFSIVGTFSETNYVYEVITTTGQVVATGKFDGAAAQLDLSGLAKGVYIISINSGESTQSTRLVIE